MSVSEMPELGRSHTEDRDDEVSPYVIVTAYGNNGQKFTQVYSMTEPGDWESLTLVKQYRHIQEFSEEVRAKFDAAVTKAVDLEQRYH